MTVSCNGASRAVNVASSNTAREKLKRRDKPYKTETQKVITKKRKLDLYTTHAKAPRGYTYLAVGTPELAELCKEMSRQQGVPVYVVNAKPLSKVAQDPEKVSHHIHRIGYHFKIDILEEAVQQLGYTVRGGKFVKQADIEQQHEATKLTEILAKYGLKVNEQANQRETAEQVRAAIKELFPRIPEADLNEIVKHAWEEGSQRVGTMRELELPRRVQLATIARIRHTYTDYDRLLRAFAWQDARKEVEPVCLQKLIEWRGEIAGEEDNELEEIVRETIVIDDDEEDTMRGSEADDEDSVTELDPGDTSDACVEISHRPAVAEDLRAEEPHELRGRYLDRYLSERRPAPQRTIAECSIVAGGMIRAMKGRMRNQPPLSDYGPFAGRNTATLTADRSYMPLHVPLNGRAEPPREIIHNGMLLRRVRTTRGTSSFIRPLALTSEEQVTPEQSLQPQQAYRDQVRPQSGASGHQYPPQSRTASAQLYTEQTTPGNGPAHNRPVVSIEHDDYAQPPHAARIPASSYAAAHRRPLMPEPDHADKRQRIILSPNTSNVAPDENRPQYNSYDVVDAEGRRYRAVPSASEVIDLTSPYRGEQRLVASRSEPIRAVSDPSGSHQPRVPAKRSAMNNGRYAQPQSHAAVYSERPVDRYQPNQEPPAPYDPRQPMMSQRAHDPTSQQADLRVKPPEQPRQQRYPPQPECSFLENGNATPQHRPYYAQRPPTVQNGAIAPVQYHQGYVGHDGRAYVPQVPPPIHGAPAPVQQVLREVAPSVRPEPAASNGQSSVSYGVIPAVPRPAAGFPPLPPPPYPHYSYPH